MSWAAPDIEDGPLASIKMCISCGKAPAEHTMILTCAPTAGAAAGIVLLYSWCDGCSRVRCEELAERALRELATSV
jgi:hypothetical protein